MEIIEREQVGSGCGVPGPGAARRSPNPIPGKLCQGWRCCCRGHGSGSAFHQRGACSSLRLLRQGWAGGGALTPSHPHGPHPRLLWVLLLLLLLLWMLLQGLRPVTHLEHANYLGREFARAEAALLSGQQYVQD